MVITGRSTSAVLGIFALLLAVGCRRHDHGTPQRPVEAGSISLSSIDPAPGTTLTAGARVTVVANVDYNYRATDEGALFLVIQDDRGNSLIAGGNNPTPARHGPGTAQLRQDVVIPAGTTKVIVYVPLGFQKAPIGSTTSTVASQEYIVEPPSRE
jgi:hypothetical protein